MALHPPLLYLGYTGLAVPFAFGVAALVTRRLDEEWLRIVRRWTLVPVDLPHARHHGRRVVELRGARLGRLLGLGPGRERRAPAVADRDRVPPLGMVAERRGGLRIWTSALVIATFTLTLVGTFLTRCGSGGQRPLLHPVGDRAVVPRRHRGRAGRGAERCSCGACPSWSVADDHPGSVSRESAFLLNNVLFLGLTFAVLFGTLLPLLVAGDDRRDDQRRRAVVQRRQRPDLRRAPLPDGRRPGAAVGQASWATLTRSLRGPAILAAVVVAAGLLLGLRDLAALVTLGLAVLVAAIMLDEVIRGARARARGRGENPVAAAWRLTTRNRRRYGGYAVHVGVLVMAVAVAISSGLATDVTVTIAPGETARIGAYEIRHDRLVVEPLADDARVIETRAELTLRRTAERDAGHRAARLPQLAGRDRHTRPCALRSGRTCTSRCSHRTPRRRPSRSTSSSTRSWCGSGSVGSIVGIGSIFAIWPETRRATAPAVESRRAPSVSPVEGA